MKKLILVLLVVLSYEASAQVLFYENKLLKDSVGILVPQKPGQEFKFTSVSGTTAFRDTASFTTSATRVAVYIAGATGADYYVATPRSQTDVLPTANDILLCQPKTDSLVVTRLTSGTSGLRFAFIRMK